MDPINYSVDVQTPFQAALQGYQAGTAIRNDQAQQQALQQAQARQQQMNTDLSAAFQDHTMLPSVMIKYPEIADKLKIGLDASNAQHAQQTLNQITPIYAALQSGNVDVAASQAADLSTAYRNANMQDKADAMDAMIAHMKVNQQDTAARLAGRIAVLPGGDKILDGVKSSILLPSDVATSRAGASKASFDAVSAGVAAANAPAKAALESRNIESQIKDRADRNALEKDKLMSDVQLKLAELGQKNGELPEYVAKGVTDATVDSIAADQSSSQMLNLADRIDKASSSMGSGVTAKTGELWKRTFGDQNELSRIRSEYSRIVTPAAMAAYKKVASGSTSDKDIETAMTGVPSDTADPATMASFLRGAAKLQVYDSVVNNSKSEWLGAVKHLGKTKSDIEIDGVKVPAGTTFKQFTDTFVPTKVKEQLAAKGAQLIQGRSYMRFAAPAGTGGQ